MDGVLVGGGGCVLDGGAVGKVANDGAEAGDTDGLVVGNSDGGAVGGGGGVSTGSW